MKKLLICFAAAALAAIGFGLYVMETRLAERPAPKDFAEARKAAADVFAAKCADCHDSSRPAPFYASWPVVGKTVAADRAQGIRHWEPFDRSYLGASAGAEEKKRALPPFAVVVKLEDAVQAGTMPPLKYRVAHWGKWLSASEKRIVAAWADGVRGAWFEKWGVAANAHPTMPAVPAVKFDAKKAALGRKLYFDKRLSTDDTVACATCHDFAKGGTDNLAFSKGVRSQLGGVSAPTVFNAVFNLRQFWDGRAADLAEQAGGPPLNPVEMASRDWNEITAKLDKDAALKAEFLAVYPKGFSGAAICDAIAEFEKTLVTPNDRFDRFRAGEKSAFDEAATRGWFAFTRHGCFKCHNGPGLGGQSFEYANLKGDCFAGRARTDGDAGLKAFSKEEKDDARFKVPQLRNVALTAPYLHDGSRKTLAEAVEFMFAFQTGTHGDKEEAASIAEFLKTLTGAAPAK